MARLPLRIAGTGEDEAATGRLAGSLRYRIDGEVRTGRHDRMLYATDASIYQVEPIAVVIPRHVDDIQETVRFCAEHALPVLPRGAGTSLAGQCANRAVVIDLSRHVDRLLDVDAGGRRARIEPGLVLDDLNAALAPHGLMFGPDVATSSHANLGGMIGNNSAGAHSILYGRTVEHVLALDVLLADGCRLHLEAGAATRDPAVAALTKQVASVIEPLAGAIDERFPRITRHVDGYNLDMILAQVRGSARGEYDQVNLAHLFCGAEGTLGVSVGAELNLVPRPAHRGLVVVAFDDVSSALAEVAGILQSGPSAVELLDAMIIDLAAANAEHRRNVPLLPHPGGRRPRAVLYVEHFADDAADLLPKQEAIAQRFGRSRCVIHDRLAPMERLWKLRKAGEPLLYGRPGRRKPITFIEDLAVDPPRLPEFIDRFAALLASHGTEASYFAHASVGCLHIRPLIELADPEDRATMIAIAEAATDLVMEYGGALSGEHGDGRLRSHLLPRFYGPEICGAFRAVKSIFDPEGRLNPGNIVDGPGMTEHLRVTEADHVDGVSRWFRFGPEGGLESAVHLCNGAGVCRRTSGGTMCPSFRATRDERHSTRGRGNALRLAVTGQLPDRERGPAWNDPDTLATLDLCLSCKACRAECPSNVDVARLKAEYLAQSYRAAGGPPRAARLFSQVRRINRLASAAAPWSGRLARWTAVRRLAGALIDMDPRRSLPPVGPSLYRWMGSRPPGTATRDAPAVVLLPDCFTVYSEPSVGRAAVRVLEALGYRVVLPRLGCCGRPHISTGLLDRAVRECSRTALRLRQVVSTERAVAVVGCEPSCVSAVTDDWTDLRLGLDPAAAAELASITTLIEEFIEQRWDGHPRRPGGLEAHQSGLPVLLHGHCHQSALWGLDAPQALLRRWVGPRLQVLDAGCCGMAGAFGYTADHYDLSMAIGGLALFPAIEAESTGLVVASGASCRHQIRDGTGRVARHPVELLCSAVDGAADDP